MVSLKIVKWTHGIDGKFCKIRCIVKKLFDINWLKRVCGVIAE